MMSLFYNKKEALGRGLSSEESVVLLRGPQLIPQPPHQAAVSHLLTPALGISDASGLPEHSDLQPPTLQTHMNNKNNKQGKHVVILQAFIQIKNHLQWQVERGRIGMGRGSKGGERRGGKRGKGSLR